MGRGILVWKLDLLNMQLFEKENDDNIPNFCYCQGEF